MKFSHKIGLAVVGVFIVGLVAVSAAYYSATPHILEENLKKNAAIFFLAVALSFLISSYLGRQLSKPLKKITDAAREVGRGNLDIRIDYRKQDEFGELANAFMGMAGGLKKAKERLEDYSGELEKKVRERTAQLKDMQEITLSILEDTNEAKAALVRSNDSLEKAQEEISEFARDLVAEKSKMESMVESMSEGVIMMDEHDDISVLNPSAREIIGIGSRDNVSIQDLSERMQKLGLTNLLQKCREEEITESEDIAIPLSGKDQFIRCDVSPVRNPGGGVIGHVTILRDITKEKELNDMKSEFVSTVSHELRTPLSITKEGISLVLDGTVGALNERQEHFLTAAKTNIDILTKIINNLLDIAKIDAGKMDLTTGPTDLSELIRQVVDSFQIRARRKGIELKTRLPPGNIIVPIDGDKITEVFVNVIGNSLKFTRKGSVEISVRDLGHEVECTIEDTGTGISRENLEKLFKKFQQFDRIEGEEKGTGLGLSIAKGIVDLHHGRIWAESEPGTGTKFHITLPRS